jgi:hypothetical protein
MLGPAPAGPFAGSDPLAHRDRDPAVPRGGVALYLPPKTIALFYEETGTAAVG